IGKLRPLHVDCCGNFLQQGEAIGLHGSGKQEQPKQDQAGNLISIRCALLHSDRLRTAVSPMSKRRLILGLALAWASLALSGTMGAQPRNDRIPEQPRIAVRPAQIDWTSARRAE